MGSVNKYLNTCRGKSGMILRDLSDTPSSAADP